MFTLKSLWTKIIACNCRSVKKHLKLIVQGDSGLLGRLKDQGYKCEETNNWKMQNQRQKKWILIYQQNSVLQKNDKKLYQKEHPASQKLKFYIKNVYFFYSKRLPSLAKNWNFAWKNHKKITKKGTKKTTQPRKNQSFVRKKVFFLLKNTTHPRKKQKFLVKKKYNFSFYFLLIFFFLFFFWFFSLDRKKNGILFIIEAKKMKFCMKNLKASYLWGFWKKKSRPPTSPNF